MINPADYINSKDNSLRIIVKPGKKENSIIDYDPVKKALIVEIAAPAIENKANKEVIKYFTKLLKKQVRIKSGLSGKEKVLIVN